MRTKYSISFLCLVILVLSICIGTYCRIKERGRPITASEQEALDELRGYKVYKGFTIVSCDYGFPEGRSFVVWLNPNCTNADETIKEISMSLKAFRRVDLYAGHSNLTDSGLQQLWNLENLCEVYVGSTKVTNDGLKELTLRNPNCKLVFTTRFCKESP